MRLNEIAPNSKITLSINVNGKILQFNTKAVLPIGDNLLVAPITKDGKTVGFNNYKVQVVYLAEDNKPLAWQNATVVLVKYKKDVFHQIIAPGPAAFLNRRDSVRQPVNVKGTIIGRDFQCEALIRDISANGISFICDRTIPDDGNIRVHFTDLDYEFSLIATVRWLSNLENTSRYVHGCQIVSKNIRIEAYILAKQKQKKEPKNDN